MRWPILRALISELFVLPERPLIYSKAETKAYSKKTQMRVFEMNTYVDMYIVLAPFLRTSNPTCLSVALLGELQV